MQNDIIVKQPPQTTEQPTLESAPAPAPKPVEPVAEESVAATPAQTEQQNTPTSVPAEPAPQPEQIEETVVATEPVKEEPFQAASKKARGPVGIIAVAIVVCALLIGLSVYAGLAGDASKESTSTKSQGRQAQSMIGIDNTDPAQLAGDVLKDIGTTATPLPDTAGDLSDASLGL